MDNFLDMLMQNSRLITDSSDYNVKELNDIVSDEYKLQNKKKTNKTKKSKRMRGGAGDEINIKTAPTGGFPPIFICNKEEKEREELENKNRGYATSKAAVQIKQILEKRKSEPFLTL